MKTNGASSGNPSSWRISGACRWVPTPYALKLPASSANEYASSAFFPAPETPLLQSAMTAEPGSRSPSRGLSARRTDVG